MDNVALFSIKPSEFIQQVANAVSAQVKADLYANSIDQNDNLTQEQACKLMNISKATLISWQNKGIIKFRKVGRRTYYSRKELLSVNTLKSIDNGK